MDRERGAFKVNVGADAGREIKGLIPNEPSRGAKILGRHLAGLLHLLIS
jgi:hypothetical protein